MNFIKLLLDVVVITLGLVGVICVDLIIQQWILAHRVSGIIDQTMIYNKSWIKVSKSVHKDKDEGTILRFMVKDSVMLEMIRHPYDLTWDIRYTPYCYKDEVKDLIKTAYKRTKLDYKAFNGMGETYYKDKPTVCKLSGEVKEVDNYKESVSV